MKRIISLLFVAVFFVSTASAAFAKNACPDITNFEVSVTSPTTFPGGFAHGCVRVDYSVNGGATKAIQVTIDGTTKTYIVGGTGTIYIELPFLIPGGQLVVTVTTYKNAKPERGKECSSETKTEEIPT